MYITICQRNHQSSSMHETGCSGLVLLDDPEEWGGEGGGRGVQDGEHMYTMADSRQCVVITTIL